MRYYNHGRLNKIFEAIDSDDTDLLWSNKKAWFKKHGYNTKGGIIGQSIFNKWKAV